MNTTPATARSSEPGPAPEIVSGLAMPSLLYVPARTRDLAVPGPAVADLHLDAVIDAMAPGRFQRAVWENLPDDPAEVARRQECVRDLRRPGMRAAAARFVAAVSDAVGALATRRQSHYPLCADVSVVAALQRFADAVREFRVELPRQEPASSRLRAIAVALASTVDGRRFAELAEGSAGLLAELCAPATELGIAGDTVWADIDGARPGWVPTVGVLLARLGADDDHRSASRRAGPARKTAAVASPPPTATRRRH